MRAGKSKGQLHKLWVVFCDRKGLLVQKSVGMRVLVVVTRKESFALHLWVNVHSVFAVHLLFQGHLVAKGLKLELCWCFDACARLDMFNVYY